MLLKLQKTGALKTGLDAGVSQRTLVDATLGLGGHSEAVLARCELARVVGIDRDPEALRRAGERLASYGDRFTGVHATYDAIPEVLADLGHARDPRLTRAVEFVLSKSGLDYVVGDSFGQVTRIGVRAVSVVEAIHFSEAEATTAESRSSAVRLAADAA